jgi:hypothetical protein
MYAKQATDQKEAEFDTSFWFDEGCLLRYDDAVWFLLEPTFLRNISLSSG